MTRWAIDLNSGARSFTRLRGEHSPADGRSLSSASDRGGIIETNDYAVDDSPNIQCALNGKAALCRVRR
jgi:hypothetical protein